MSKRQRNRQHLRCSPSFQAIMEQFSTAQLAKIMRHSRKLIDDWELQDGYHLMRIPFSMFNYDFLLELNMKEEWVLSVIGSPDPGAPAKRIRGPRRRLEDALRPAPKTLPARARPPRKAVMKRIQSVTHRLMSYKMALRQMRALFEEKVEAELGRAARRVNWLAGMLRSRFDSFTAASHAPAIAMIAERFVEDSERSVARSHVARLGAVLYGLEIGIPLRLSGWNGDGSSHEAWDVNWFGELVAESEMLR